MKVQSLAERGKSKWNLQSPAASSSPKAVLWPLDDDVTMNIVGRLDTEFILRKAQFVCTAWYRVCKRPDLFRVIGLKYEEGSKLGIREFDDMCICAVERSQGQLLDIKISNHGELDLLNFISGSRELRRLTLHNHDVCPRYLVEVIGNLPQLQDLHLIMPNRLIAGEIGISADLSSFTYHHFWGVDSRAEVEGASDHGMAIAESMANLRHLRLITDPIQSQGLKAILDKCVHLDIRGCKKLRLTGDILKRCHKITNLRLPGDSIDDLTSNGWSIYPSDDDDDAEVEDDELVVDDEDAEVEDDELADDDAEVEDDELVDDDAEN